MPGEVDVTCPCCGEPGTVVVEEEEGDAEFVQDCAVCCRPWQQTAQKGREFIIVRLGPGGPGLGI
jgi:hypothetical protein